MSKWHEWKYPILSYILFFFLLWGFMWAVRQIYPALLLPDEIYRPYLGISPTSNSFLDIWQRWDTLQYQAIAEHGYLSFENALFVPPLYPLLMRFLGTLLNGNTLLAGLILSNIFGLSATVALYELMIYEFKAIKMARRATFYLLSFPTAFFIFAAYTESLFLLGAILTLLYLRQEKWLLAGIWGAIAALSRLPGALMLIPALYTAWAVWRKTRELRPWLAPLITALGAAIFPLYTWLGLGLSPFAPLTTQTSRFHGGLTVPGWNILMALKQISLGIYPITNSFDLFFTLLFLAGTLAVLKKMPVIYSVYTLSFIALYLFRIAAVYPLLSNSRYVLSLFPVFMLIAKWGEKPSVNRLILYPSWLGLIFLSGQFAIWGWVG